MKYLPIVVVIAGLATGCSKRKLHWSDVRATTVTVGAFSAPIPAGWRDASEASDDDMKKLLAKQPGARVLVRDDFDGASIVIKSGPNTGTGAPPCEDIANGIAKAEGATATGISKITVEGDAACAWTYAKGEMTADYWTRFHGDKVLAVMCFPQKKAENTATCEEIRKTLHAAP